MTQQATTITQKRPLLAVLAVALIVLAALAAGAQGASAQEGTTWEWGNFCVKDYEKNAQCTAEDVKIANISPTIQEACMAAGDSATVLFDLEIVSNATTRYDVGIFIATAGGSALDGDMCYHDFLQPNSTTEPWDLTGGHGPFKELERGANADLCGDILSVDGTHVYQLQREITVLCVDNDNDGAVDPFSTCTSWDINEDDDCTTVKGAVPTEPSKCKCTTQSPGLLIYRGYDWGDLPNSYQTLLANDGARHAIQDQNNDGVPETISYTYDDPDPAIPPVTTVVPAVWLGSRVDFSPKAEADGQPNTAATGDDNALTDDEDGIAPFGDEWDYGTDGGQISVNVNSSSVSCIGCKLGFWIDWNGDGDFDDAGESYVEPVVFGPQTLKFDIPIGALSNGVYARFRLYAGDYQGDIKSYGLAVNGEVEDYYFAVPTAVVLLRFTATAERKAIVLAWETASEINNLGFNLYRAKKVDGERTRINAEIIPSNVYPGSQSGATYKYPDTTFTGNRTFYYWLEAVNNQGPNDLYGPVVARAARGLDPKDPPSKTEVK